MPRNVLSWHMVLINWVYRVFVVGWEKCLGWDFKSIRWKSLLLFCFFFKVRLPKIPKPLILFIASQLLWRNFGKKHPNHSSTVLTGETLNTVTGSTFWISQGKTSLSTKPQGCASVLSREHSPGLPLAPLHAYMVLLLRSPAILRHPSRSTRLPPRHTQTQVTLRASRSCECQSPTLISSPSNSQSHKAGWKSDKGMWLASDDVLDEDLRDKRKTDISFSGQNVYLTFSGTPHCAPIPSPCPPALLQLLSKSLLLTSGKPSPFLHTQIQIYSPGSL